MKKFTANEIREAWNKYQEDELSEEQFAPYYESMLDQHMWDIFYDLICEYNMPRSVQAWFVKRPDADEIMSHYCMYSGFEGEEIAEGNGAAFLRNKNITPQTVHAFIERFYLKESDQLAFFEIKASGAKPHIGDFLRHYQKQWGLVGKAWDKAEKYGHCK